MTIAALVVWSLIFAGSAAVSRLLEPVWHWILGAPGQHDVETRHQDRG